MIRFHTFPDELKTTIINQIYKSNNHKDFKKYRPINELINSIVNNIQSNEIFINIGVLQGSTSNPLHFLIFV